MSQELDMMNVLAKHIGMKVSMFKTDATPYVLIGTCYGRYPAAVLSRTRAVTGQPNMYHNDTQYFIEHNGASLETYDAYCRGAKELKVTTIKYFCDGGKWITAKEFWAKYLPNS